MKEETALITGAARRIGKAIALSLADKGINIILHYNSSEQEAQDCASLIRKSGVKLWLIKADLSKTEETEYLFEKAKKEAGYINILINNASIFLKDKIINFSYSDLFQNIKINAIAPLILSKKIAAQENEGNIINLLDSRISDYDSNHAAYHLSKRMLYDLTRMMALEFAPKIRVNGVAPGLILPPPGEDPSFLEKLAPRNNPLQTYGNLKDITAAIWFLLNSHFITGQVIYIDGGRHVHGCMYGT